MGELTNFGFYKPAEGEDGWATQVNNNADLLEDAFNANKTIPAIDTERGEIESQPESYHVFEKSGTTYAVPQISGLSSYSGAVASTLQSAIDETNANGGGTVAIKGLLDPSGSTVTVKQGVHLAGFGRIFSGNNTEWGSGLAGSQASALVEMERSAKLDGILLRNSSGIGVSIVEKQAEIDSCWIEAESKGVTDENAIGTINELQIHGNTWVSNYTGTFTTAPPAGSVGVELTNTEDPKILGGTYRYFETGIIATKAAPDIDGADVYTTDDSSGTVGIKVAEEGDINNCTISQTEECVKLTGNNSGVIGCRLELPTDGTCVHIDFPSSQGLSKCRVTNNQMEDTKSSANSTGVAFTNVSDVSEAHIKNNVYRDINDEGEKTVNSGVASFDGDGATSFFQISHGLPDDPSGNVSVIPATPDAREPLHVGIGVGVLNVTLSNAPPSGTDNVQFRWRAEI